MEPEPVDAVPDSENEISRAITMIKAGDRAGAKRVLGELLNREPNNEKAWLWMSTCVADADKRVYCLERALMINPANRRTRESLRKYRPNSPLLDIPLPEEEAFAEEAPSAESPPAPEASEPPAAPPPQTSAARPVEEPPTDSTRRVIPTMERFNRLAIPIAIGAVVFLVIIILLTIFSQTPMTDAFRSEAEQYIQLGDNLETILTQPIGLRTFMDQMSAITASYQRMQTQWPSRTPRAIRSNLDCAMQGWGLALEVWTYGVEESSISIDMTYLPNGELMTRAIDYLNYPADEMIGLTITRWIEILSDRAAVCYAAGRTQLQTAIAAP